MGYMRHHAIIVSSWDKKSISLAHEKARELFFNLSDLIPSIANGYQSFLIPPDGSKEGWEESDKGDGQRAIFCDWLTTQVEDGAIFLSWVEIQYGDDNGDNCVLQSECRSRK